jgi:hypothetical protein
MGKQEKQKQRVGKSEKKQISPLRVTGFRRHAPVEMTE